MRAIVQTAYGPPDVLEFREIDRPAIGDDDVLTRSYPNSHGGQWVQGGWEAIKAFDLAGNAPRVAEEAGAVAVMALERVPADIRRDGGVARMSDPTKIEEIQAAVTIPVMAKCRIGHFVEAQVLESLGVDYIDEPLEAELAGATRAEHLRQLMQDLAPKIAAATTEQAVAEPSAAAAARPRTNRSRKFRRRSR